jgi:hypothetical protein
MGCVSNGVTVSNYALTTESSLLLTAELEMTDSESALGPMRLAAEGADEVPWESSESDDASKVCGV